MDRLADRIALLPLSLHVAGDVPFIVMHGDLQPLGWQPTTLGAVQWPGPVDPTRVLVYADDKTLATRLHGKIAAFGAKKHS